MCTRVLVCIIMLRILFLFSRVSPASASFCLACGQTIAANDLQILRNEASSNVRIMWQCLLDDKLKQKNFRVDVASALGDERSPGCVHKKCFMSIKSFAEKMNQFLDKLDAAIDQDAIARSS